MIHPVKTIIDGLPTFETPLGEILQDMKLGGALKVLSPLEYHTDRQRRWYRGICLKGLSDWSGDTVDEWDLRLKAECNGVELLKKDTIFLGVGMTCTRLTIVGVGKRNMTAFIEGILSKGIEMDWKDTEGKPIIVPPDKELRK